jgi:hypothetical protein
MIIELNEKNFKEEVSKQDKILVFFYRETGCSFCTKMKPVVAKYAESNVVGMYKLGQAPDSVTEDIVERFPTFMAYEKGLAVGKQEGSMSIEQLALTFTPDKIQAKSQDPRQPGPLTIETAPLVGLLTEEANLIDQIGPLKEHLTKVRAEIKRRKQLAGIIKKKNS